MSTYAVPSVMFGSPGDWDKFFWDVYHDLFLPILQRACNPAGMQDFLKRATLSDSSA